MNIYESLINIQKKLKAPKNQYNSYGGFDYRSCEDIFEAVKPLLTENKLSLVMSDEIVLIGDRYYVKATATLTNGEQEIQNIAYAREDFAKKGMDGSQITGASSSYARKYALNGLFLIDDVKDNDNGKGGDTSDKKSKDDNTRLKLYSRITELEFELDIPHEKTLEIYKVESNAKMTEAQLQDCVNRMEKKLKERESK